MFGKTRRRTAKAVRTAFEVLIAHPDGLHPHTILQYVKEKWPERDWGSLEHEQVWGDLLYGSIAPQKASWMFHKEGRWAVTEAGREAFHRYTDPLRFLDEAGRLSFKGWFAAKFPGPIATIARARYQMLVELRLIHRVGVAQLARDMFGITTPWQKALPVQQLRRFQISGVQVKTLHELLAYLRSRGAKYMAGGHTVYLPPDSWSRTAFAAIQKYYPSTAGLKIIKNPGGVNDSNYVHTSHQGISKLHKKITYSHRHLSLVSNTLYAHGIGPRLYDLVELQLGDQTWTANVFEHVEGRTPTHAETEAGLERIREMEAQRIIRVTIPDGYNDEDFLPPDCNKNAIVGRDGKWRYVDHQNFLLVDYGNYLKKVALESADDSHYGDRSVLRGNRYLYQSVPGVAVPGKRNAEKRMETLTRMMERAGVTVKDRLVLDVGCNVGMMMAQYLKQGAMWCHGWDHENVTPQAEKLLYAIGCTRFSVTGGNILQHPRPEDDLPQFLHSHLNGCAISYLAVHNWIGWVEMIGRLPWSFMIFEGHENDTDEHNQKSFDILRKMTRFEVAEYGQAQDGDSESRAIAILIRK
ncbi:MAG: hypothetical protein DMG76_13510 [Acidobacteria bacterium]|nr:MAG: hypothetical protein DMG76_13510 [Acidobacteriota bacterium]